MATSFLLYSMPVVDADKARDREKKWYNMIGKWDVWIGPKQHKVSPHSSLTHTTHPSMLHITSCVLLYGCCSNRVYFTTDAAKRPL